LGFKRLTWTLTGPTSAELDRLDTLYREDYKNSEAEQAVLNEEPYELKNQVAIMQALAASRTNEEAQPRNGAVPKSRKFHRQGGDSDTVADSPGPSPSESRKDGLKRVKGATQRSSSVPSSARAGAGGKIDDDGALSKGVRAERDGQFVVGAEVFYRHPKGALNVEGEGIQCIIKKVWLDKKPCVDSPCSPLHITNKPLKDRIRCPRPRAG
jgi:SAGA-associated factor 29